MDASGGVGGAGGTIHLTAGGDITLQHVRAAGGAGGAGGTVELLTPAQIVALRQVEACFCSAGGRVLVTAAHAHCHGDLILGPDGRLEMGVTPLTVAGDVTVESGAVLRLNPGTEQAPSIRFAGTGPQTWRDESGADFGRVRVEAGSHVVAGGGSGAGKVQMQDFHFTGRIDVASPGLLVAMASGRVDGRLHLLGGRVSVGSGLSLEGGTLSGSGTVTGNVANAGLIAPGEPAPSTVTGILDLRGAYSQSGSGRIELDLRGPEPGTTHGQVRWKDHHPPVVLRIETHGNPFETSAAFDGRIDRIRVAFSETPSFSAASAAADRLEVIVPPDAQTGPVTVQVGGRAVSPQPFTVTPPPVVGDVNRDGLADFVVSAYNHAVAGAAGVGRVEVRSGADGALLRAVASPDTAPGTYFGAVVTLGGDLDGDGRADFVVGAPAASPGGRTHAGSVFLYSGASGALLRRLDGPTAGERFGASLAVGDVDADGRVDVAVGAPRATVAGVPEVGYCAAYSGVDGTEMLRIEGDAMSERLFGTVVMLPNRPDGCAPMVPGSTGCAPVIPGQIGCMPVVAAVGTRDSPTQPGLTMVAVRATSWRDGALVALWSQAFDEPCGPAGQAPLLTGVSGCDTLVVGAPGCAPLGRPSAGTVWVLEASTGAVLARHDGAAAGDRFGEAVALHGDRLAVGAPDADVAGLVDAGRVTVLRVSDGAVLGVQEGTDAGGRFGSSLELTATRLAVGEPAFGDWTGRLRVIVAPSGPTIFSAQGTQADELYGWLRHENRPLAVPVELLTVPGSPSSDPLPRVCGRADPGTIIELFRSVDPDPENRCNGFAIRVGPNGASGETPKDWCFHVPVHENATNRFAARAVSPRGYRSACSAPIEYVHDSLPPPRPVITSLTPASASNQREPELCGTAEAGTTIQVHPEGACGTLTLRAGPNSAGTWCMRLAVQDEAEPPTNKLVRLIVRAVDAAGNASACSDAVAYLRRARFHARPTGPRHCRLRVGLRRRPRRHGRGGHPHLRAAGTSAHPRSDRAADRDRRQRTAPRGRSRADAGAGQSSPSVGRSHRRRRRHGLQRSVGYLLRGGLHDHLRGGHGSDLDGHAGACRDLCGLERSLFGHRPVRGDDGPGARCGGDLRIAAAGHPLRAWNRRRGGGGAVGPAVGARTAVAGDRDAGGERALAQRDQPPRADLEQSDLETAATPAAAVPAAASPAAAGQAGAPYDVLPTGGALGRVARGDQRVRCRIRQ